MIQYIMTDIYNILRQYLVPNVVIGLALTLICSRMFREERTAFRKRLLFFIYLAFVFELTLLTREAGSRTSIDLRLFGTFYDNDYAMSFVYENVLLMIPLGILLPWNMKWFQSFLRCTLSGFVLTVSIEVTQLITQRGYFQVDDIWLNVVGTMCGYSIFKVITMLRQK